jgi:seryl-tRNA synthetase
MLDSPPQAAAQEDTGLPIPTDVPGVFLYPESFETIIAVLRRGIAALAATEPVRRLLIPPVISRRAIEHAGYVKTFPQLLGTVHSYGGTSREWGRLAPLVDQGGEWHSAQTISDLVLLPAACYPVYASIAGRDLDEPARFAVDATCFRQEATSETGRLRSFRMSEIVTAGTEVHCQSWRGTWLDRVAAWFTAMGLQVSVEVADDPFFGPGRKLFQAAQRVQELKLELKVPVTGDTVQAIASANYHKDHFGEVYGFRAGGEVGHTSCMAFGLERIALALINAHGSRCERWPGDVRTAAEGTHP